MRAHPENNEQHDGDGDKQCEQASNAFEGLERDGNDRIGRTATRTRFRKRTHLAPASFACGECHRYTKCK